jgi:hypothetical protein
VYEGMVNAGMGLARVDAREGRLCDERKDVVVRTMRIDALESRPDGV